MDDRKFTLVTDKLDSKYEKPSGIKFPKALYEDEYFRGISAEGNWIYESTRITSTNLKNQMLSEEFIFAKINRKRQQEMDVRILR